MMLPMQPKSKRNVTDGSAVLRTGSRSGVRRPRLKQILPFVLLMAALAACAPGEAPPAAICDTYNRALFTTQLMGGASVLLGLAVLGFRKNLSAILPSQGAQIGAVAGSVFLGLILLAFSTDIGNQILTGFGIESMYTLCGLG
jgi:hypothetical protein